MPFDGNLAFDELLQRIHPAESRIKLLARETPAELVVFDLLVDDGGTLLSIALCATAEQRSESFARPLSERQSVRSICLRRRPISSRQRNGFSTWPAGSMASSPRDSIFRINPATAKVCKRLKTFARRIALLAAFAMPRRGRWSDRLLLGLYDDAGLLHHVGFTSAIAAAEKSGSNRKLGKHHRAARVHRRCARRPEPLGYRTIDRVGAASPKIRRGSAIRSLHRRTFSTWHETPSLASG